MRPTARRPLALAALAVLLLAGAAQADPYDQQREDRNFEKTKERAAITGTPEYRVAALQYAAADTPQFALELATDPGRTPSGACTLKHTSCSGDVRLAGWAERAGGISEPVTFVARNGSVYAGHVWATKAGLAKRPVAVVVNGSVQAPEELYYFAALTLAKAGYVVLTYDPQGQGRSDQVGEGPDLLEGVHSQVAGSTFYDGPQDAIDFALSTPATPYVPRDSRGGHNHAAKQEARVARGEAAHNPLWSLVDPTRVGLAGHSYGASGVSYTGQADPRVDAIVAWDNLCAPDSCISGGRPEAPVAITKPALGMSADYGLVASKKSEAPDPMGRSAASLAYSQAGVDTGQINIRGGTHYEFSFIGSSSFPATLRGADLTAWYTLAWFDKYVKGDRTADSRLLTDRWRDDRLGAEVDLDGDGNLFSFYYPSRLDIRSGGKRVVCEDLRAGCKQLKRDKDKPDFTYFRGAGLAD